MPTPTDFTWNPSDAETYHEMLGMVPPAEQLRSGFLYGEPIDIRGPGGATRFRAYRVLGGVYEVSSRPVTRAEFRAAMAGV